MYLKYIMKPNSVTGYSRRYFRTSYKVQSTKFLQLNLFLQKQRNFSNVTLDHASKPRMPFSVLRVRSSVRIINYTFFSENICSLFNQVINRAQLNWRRRLQFLSQCIMLYTHYSRCKKKLKIIKSERKKKLRQR